MLNVNILTALNCEAKAVIDFYKLKKVRNRPFDYYTGIYHNKKTDVRCAIHVLVSGLGARNMATACGWLAGYLDQTCSAWLNLGTAGHKQLEVSTVVRVHRAIDMQTGDSYYPTMTAKWSGVNSALFTFDNACTDYPEDVLVDMEGAAFFNVASKFSSSELVQSLKVVSDNESESIERLNAKLLSELIQQNIQSLDIFISALLILQIQVIEIANTNKEYLDIIDSLHSTVSQRQQYRELIGKLMSLGAFNDLDKKKILEVNSMSQVLKALNNKLQESQLNLQALSNRGQL